jgi:hypothetical protein
MKNPTEKQIEAFLKDVGNGFWNKNNRSIVDRDEIDKEAYELYLETGHTNMWFEDYYSIGDGLEELIEDENEELLEYIAEYY